MRRVLSLGVLFLVACGSDVPATPELDATTGADAGDGGMSNACANNSECDDGVHCNGVETCDANDPNADPTTHCVGGTSIVCNDGNTCTTDRCDEATDGCVFTAVAQPCVPTDCPSDVGWADCDGDTSTRCETSTRTLTDCGACGVKCGAANQNASCATGSCTVAGCQSGFGDCDTDLANGCETPLDTVSDCGACRNTCNATGGTAECGGGTCGITCSSSSVDCDNDLTNGCEADRSSDPNNCGACGHVCNPSGGSLFACSGGTCFFPGCPLGTADCDGSQSTVCEVDYTSDPGNCGSCGWICGPGGICDAGACIDTCPSGTCAPIWDWLRQPAEGGGAGIAADLQGNVYVTGGYAGVNDFGGSALTGSGLFVASYVGATNTHRWSRGFGGGSGSGVAVDTSGSVYLTGNFSTSVDFGGGVLTGTPAGTNGGKEGDIFVASLDAATGAHRWSIARGGDDADEALGVAAIGDNVVVTGRFRNTVDFGGGPLTSAGGADVFVASFDATTGAHRWSRAYGGSGSDSGNAVAVDASGNAYVVGSYTGSIDFGGGELQGVSEDMFVVSLTSLGGHRWSRRFGNLGNDRASAVAVDGLGNVYVSGAFAGTVDFGGGPRTGAAPLSIFLGSFDAATGAHRWSRSFGFSQSNWASGLGANASGQLLMTGMFWYDIAFGGALVSGGSNYGSAYAVSFDGATGTHRWSGYVGSGYGNAAAVDAAGVGYATGTIVTSTYNGSYIRERNDIFILAHGS